MSDLKQTLRPNLSHLKWPLALTRLGLIAERLVRAFWPLFSVVFVVLSALMFGVQDVLSLELYWAGAVLSVLAVIVTFGFGLRQFRWPLRQEAQARLDEKLPGRPIAAILDEQVVGKGDVISRKVWDTHVARMQARTLDARAVPPDLNLNRRDPYAMRYVAVLALLMAMMFGSVMRVASLSELTPGATGVDLSGGPAWEGWVEPPAYTGKPSIYLADIKAADLTVPIGSRLTLRLYGEVGSLSVAETVSGRVGDIGSVAEPRQVFEINQSGSLEILGSEGAVWVVNVIPDTPPVIELGADIERRASGDLHLPFSAQDDYGVQSGYVELALDLEAVDRRFGLAPDPEPRELITLDLPMPFTGDRRAFAEILVENLAEHPWAGLPVTVSLFARDAADQIGVSAPETIDLPGRRFFDPLAAAIVEQRRDLLWNRENVTRVTQVLRTVSNRPEDLFDSSSAYLKLRFAIHQLEDALQKNGVNTTLQIETAQVLWDIALLIEDGNLADAKERLERAQERLQQAMRDGASDDEIAELMDELREAMQDYMQQLAEQQRGQQDQQLSDNQDTQEISPDELQDMLDRLQELMEQGRMSEAEELMDQLGRMMENLQITEGQGQQSPGQQSLNELGETLRQQQGLNDDTFSDLQQQYDQQGQSGEQGQQQGEQGQGGQQGEQGQSGQGGQQGQGQQQGSGEGRGNGNEGTQGLAGRQQALRDQLGQQSQNLPGTGTQGGGTGADALDRAGRAMEGAEQALRGNDNAGALDQQSEALEALREGMRELAEELAQQQGDRPGQQGEAPGQARNGNQRDPLGREVFGSGRAGTDEQLLQGEDVYRRAQELLEDIRRRASDQDRPTLELDYLKRLLDQF